MLEGVNESLTSNDIAVLGCIVEPMATSRTTQIYKRVVGYVLELKKEVDIHIYPLLPTAETGMHVDTNSTIVRRYKSGDVALLNTFETCNLIARKQFEGVFRGTPSKPSKSDYWEKSLTNGIFRQSVPDAGVMLRLVTLKNGGYSASLVSERKSRIVPRLSAHFISCAVRDEYGEFVVRKGFEDFEVFVPGNKIRKNAKIEQKQVIPVSFDVDEREPNIVGDTSANSVEVAEAVSDTDVNTNMSPNEFDTVGTTSADSEDNSLSVVNEYLTSDINITSELQSALQVSLMYPKLKAGRNYYTRGGVLLRVDATTNLKEVYITCEMALPEDRWLIMSTNNLAADTLSNLEISEFVLTQSAIKRDDIHKLLSPYWDTLSTEELDTFNDYNTLVCNPDIAKYVEFEPFLRSVFDLAIKDFLPLGIT